MAVFTGAERVEVWGRRQAGESNRSIERRLGRSAGSIRAFVEASGGVRPAVRRRPVRHLSLVEREETSRGVAGGESLRVLARRLGRAPSTLSRHAARNGGRLGYRAHRADQATCPPPQSVQTCREPSVAWRGRRAARGSVVAAADRRAAAPARTLTTRRCA